MEARRDLVERPYFSICVPQYNRTSFFIEACRSLAGQTFRDFEVCISDDCSTDGRESELLAYLEGSGLSFVYRKQEKNTRYDGNLRAGIGLARGRYCFLLGNDDGLATPDVLRQIHDEIERLGPAAVAITNYEDFATGKPYRRVQRTGIVGSGPAAAVAEYRNFSFVSGILLDREQAQAFATTAWDGSEMYQMYIGCRIIAAGGPILGLAMTAVRFSIQVPGLAVDSYATRPRLRPCPIVARRLPLTVMGGLVVDAVRPFLRPASAAPTIERIFQQILLFTYPFWIIEHRKVQSWKYALGVCLGMAPRYLFEKVGIGTMRRARLSLLYSLSSVAGLLTPVWIFDLLRARLYQLAKSSFRNA